MITNLVVNFLYDTFADRLRNLNQPWLPPQHLQMYAHAIHNRGAALDNCWGFIDGTVKPICRPKDNQREVYNGHKRVHALKFQSVVTPNGLIANLFGPVEKRRHDSGMLNMSGILHDLEHHSFSPTGQALCLYGDPAYPHRVHLQCQFARRPNLTPEEQALCQASCMHSTNPWKSNMKISEEQAFNQSMSQVRISVEWVFGDIVNYFKFTDFKKDLKIALSAVGKIYMVCALLRNALTCLYGNTSEFLDVDPPSLDKYFK